MTLETGPLVIDGLRLVVGMHNDKLALWVRGTNPLRKIKIKSSRFEMMTLVGRGEDIEGPYLIFQISNPFDGPALNHRTYNDDIDFDNPGPRGKEGRGL